MTRRQPTVGDQQSEDRTQHTVKRRGILAAAGAVVAGIVAKQTAQPVAAAFNMQAEVAQTVNASTELNALSGFSSTGFQSNAVFFVKGSTAVTQADVGGVWALGTGASSGVTGVAGGATMPSGALNVGVYGTGVGAGKSGVNGVSDSGTGVGGVSTSGAGVRGFSTSGNGAEGHSTNAAGVAGFSDGASQSGVYGQASHGSGVEGKITSTNSGFAGVFGQGNGSGTFGMVGFDAGGGVGVQGQSVSGVGVYGTAANNYGVLGTSSKAGFAGLTGITSTANVPAFAGGSSTPSALAAYFNGGVYVDCTTVGGGQFVVNPMTAKSGLLKHPDGSHRLMYSIEAPESWAEDFGKATLINGKADVKIDPDFAAVIHTDDYHVFLTTYGESNGLFVTKQGASGFAVQERNKGASSIQFSWRIVAKPKVDNHTALRLAKYDLPAPLHMPTADELPKVAPAVPTAKKP